jgi:hypothetical protein
MNIFLSHASQDKGTAESIAFSLRSRGHKVFLDRDDLPAGESFDQQIESAVEESDIFIFLISPESVAEGHYTLTELTFARRKWQNPSGRVLPVMARKTPLEQIPSYLKAVTILEPLGNITAETSAAVEHIRPPKPPILRSIAGGIAVLCAAIAVIWWFYNSDVISSFFEQEPQPPQGRGLWVVDRSYVYLEANGANRQFIFIKPNRVLSDQGAHRGSMLFDGQNINETSYSGKVFVYAGRRCPTREYDASGPISDGGVTVTLTGQAPQIDPETCSKTGEQEQTLVFKFRHR